MGTDFRVGDWIVRPGRNCIDLQGKTTHVTPKSMAVLECLAKAGGEVVSRNDILDTVWPGAAVTDDVLTHSISELRKAFGDSPQDPEVIETIPKKGLRLILEISWDDDSAEISSEPADSAARASAPDALRIGMLIALAVIVAVIGWPYLAEQSSTSIAVLPFEDLSESQDQKHLAFGVAEQLAQRLSLLRGLDVYGPRAALEYSGPDSDARTAVRELSTDFLLDGSIRRSEEDLRITAVLTDVSDRSQKWAHSFDREFGDVLEIEDEIAAAVARALSVELEVGDTAARIGETSNPDAHEEVLRGDLSFFATRADLDKAFRHYTRATEIDPDYAIAWQRVALIHNSAFSADGYSHADDYRDLARDAIARALLLAPNSREVILVAAEMEFYDRDWSTARLLYDRAMRLGGADQIGNVSPSMALNVHINALYKLGYVDEYYRLIERLNRLRPLAGEYVAFLSQAYLAKEQYPEAFAVLERAFPEARGAVHVAAAGLSVALSARDDAQIRTWMNRLQQEGDPVAVWSAENMKERLGDRDRALAWLEEASGSNADVDYYIVLWASYYGDDQLVLKAMDRSRDLWLFWLPLTSRVRATDEFKAIVRDMGLVEYWRAYGWNDFCQPLGDDDFECR